MPLWFHEMVEALLPASDWPPLGAVTVTVTAVIVKFASLWSLTSTVPSESIISTLMRAPLVPVFGTVQP